MTLWRGLVICKSVLNKMVDANASRLKSLVRAEPKYAKGLKLQD